MDFEKRVKKIIYTWCRWNVSNLYEPQNTNKLKSMWEHDVSKLVIDSVEWSKYTAKNHRNNKKVLK